MRAAHAPRTGSFAGRAVRNEMSDTSRCPEGCAARQDAYLRCPRVGRQVWEARELTHVQMPRQRRRGGGVSPETLKPRPAHRMFTNVYVPWDAEPPTPRHT